MNGIRIYLGALLHFVGCTCTVTRVGPISCKLLLQLLRQAQEAQAAQQPESSPEPAQGPETEPKAAPEILISVAQPPYRLTAEAASKLTVRAFSALWTVSAHVQRITMMCLVPFMNVMT